ncbi:MAG: alpha/beta hydrolase-fold protein [Cardiobacteriaceae bacterium]|nr:alpha/beta hydrolase-fold protein [Cardiobacteriaceae bacterium]
MNTQQRSHWSGELGQEMPFNVYGHGGKAVLVFPSSGGNQYEYGAFGMIEACRSWIDRGLLTFYCPDSYDQQSWLSKHKLAHDMAQAHAAYDRYIVNELVPLIRHESPEKQGIIATGCSMGAFHTINFALRHPFIFDIAIALSGVYDARFFTQEYHGDQAVYYHSPADYLWHQHDDATLQQYRRNHYIIAVGQGAWEEEHIAATQKLQSAFEAKSIPAWFDYWGHDVDHDWPWWKVQMPYFLTKLEEQGFI